MSLGELARCALDASGLIELLIRHQPVGAGSDPAVRTAHRRALEALRQAAESAQSPFGIGLAGELSAGKSLLLGLLLGLPELLPVGDEAVTGNVTVIHAKAAGPEVRASSESAVRVEYFTEPQALAYLRHLRDAMADQAQDSGLDARTAAQLRQVEFQEPDCRELVHFRDAHLSGDLAKPMAGVLGELDLMDEALNRARALGRPLLGFTAELNETLARSAVVLPGPAEYRALDPRTVGNGITAELLRATLPLVRRVVREVQVAPSVWDLNDFPGEELLLLDFPGLNNAFSAVRDQYVCGAELRSVHTLLILLKTTGGATDTPERIMRMWQAAQRPDAMENSVLAVISRFHELRVSKATLGPYLVYDGQPLTRDRLLDGTPALRDLLAGAGRLVARGRDDRIVLTSAMRALSAGGWRERVGKAFWDARHLETQLPLADQSAALWQAVGARLETDDVGSGLGRMLTAFADDGGLARLRRCLFDHVTEHGVALRMGQFADRRVNAAQALKELHAALEASGGQGRADHRAETEVRRRLTGLISVWSTVRDTAGTELLDARRLHRQREGTTPAVTLLEEVERDAAEKVYAWPSWGRLLDAVHEEHVDPRYLLGDRPAPLRTDELFADFRDSCREIESRNAGRLLAAVEAWLLAHQQRVVQAARELGTVITPEAFEQLRSGPDGPALVRRLSRATSFQWLRDEAEKVLHDTSAPGTGGDEAELRDRFPLRMGHLLPWHPDSPFGSSADSAARHQTAIARHRRDLTAMVLHQSLTRLAATQRTVSKRLRDETDSFIAELRAGQLAHALVTAVAGGTAGEPGSAQFMEELRLLADVSVYSWQRSAWDSGPAGSPFGAAVDPGSAQYGDVFHGGGMS
ncbi:hypothetical protein AB0F96_12100 [Streptomyces sp. NPDC023998]|uniref:hypothetical protein n=2 Tax=unclassified Streptomyces TaxID=2593676 RepID=UPI0033C35C36